MQSAILIVDDEPAVISALKRLFVDEPYEVFTASSGPEGLEHLRNERIKVVICDEKMPGMKGNEFMEAAKQAFPETVRIILTGHANVNAALKAINCGEIYRFFEKPWSDMELKLSVKSAVEKYDLENENRRLLEMVKRQACELKQLEKVYPGMTHLDKDEEGNLVLEDLSDTEMNEVMDRIMSES